ncbi:hypothetical protein PROFUN_16249 [Planoprotostelium fungivorum]|uniref:Tyrosine-protein kinase catalytic domain-containing protein n=1 Tax=Planoprotostelium fungivorum TaxID=1890364 RepID=A0A2P6MRJ0_9EUKA|nr:hypothetical protein PROFUN_16249 [Planoprotostelium fungivorum]
MDVHHEKLRNSEVIVVVATYSSKIDWNSGWKRCEHALYTQEHLVDLNVLQQHRFSRITCNNGNVIQILLSRPLSGSLNPKIGDLDTLQSLTIQGANLNGLIPSSTLYLCSNNLTGSIPSSISNVSNLQCLDLNGNNLTGFQTRRPKPSRERDLIVEATTLKSMHHPNIVMYISQDTAEGYYVMEHMNGGSLQQYMTSRALDPSSVLVIAADVARGLSYLTSINMHEERGRAETGNATRRGKADNGRERILCFNNDLLYEATIMGIEQRDGKENYQIHYEGWDEKRDEWVNIEKLKKLNKENLRMQAFLRAEVKQQAPKAPTPIKSQVTTKKKTKDQFEIVLPTQIRERLVEDQRMINKKFLTEVPRTPNIEQIIGDFTKDYFAVMQVIDTYPTEKKNEILFNLKFTYNPFIAQKIADDLIRFFDEICGNVLVYRFERKQFTTATKLSASLSQVYGIEYLMRFLGLKRTVKIPLFIDRAELEEDALLHTK